MTASVSAPNPATSAAPAKSTPGRPPARGMVWVPGGRFQMGSDHHNPEEAPAHPAEVQGYWMDRAPVTNADFRKFIKATGYRTQAERPADPADYPGAQPEQLQPASIVFIAPAQPVALSDTHAWWHYVPGANWRHPEGPGSSIKERDQHPVVHISHADAEAYAHWAGKQLPTEPEWERAAWGGRENSEFAWGDELHPGGRMLANTWQGAFPHQNSRADGYERTSPVGRYPANGYGLVDMIGNVWEWTSSWYRSGHQANTATAEGCCAAAEAARLASIDRHSEHGAMPRKVVKGGSYLCAPSYCRRYRPAARMAQGIDTSTGHMGFRCVVRPPA
ncbi:MAG: formylglycine-generating enzyme family protein [Cyanobium sp.]